MFVPLPLVPRVIVPEIPRGLLEPVLPMAATDTT
jgi:hypothetical protein